MSMDRKEGEAGVGPGNAPVPYSAERLPAEEYREVVPELEENTDLLDYAEILLRRKWTVITVLVTVFVTTLLVSLAMTPVFKAQARLEVSPAGPW